MHLKQKSNLKGQHSDTSCNLLSSSESESEISEGNESVVDMDVQPNFIEYTLTNRPVHVKILKQKAVKTEDVTDMSAKYWKLQVNLHEKNKTKKHMEGVRVHRKISLQRQWHSHHVKTMKPCSATNTSLDEKSNGPDESKSKSVQSQLMINDDHNYSLCAASETNKKCNEPKVGVISSNHFEDSAVGNETRVVFFDDSTIEENNGKGKKLIVCVDKSKNTDENHDDDNSQNVATSSDAASNGQGSDSMANEG